MNRAVISVGSNIRPRQSISKAKGILSKEQKLLSESRLVKTKPKGLKEQPDFLNGAFCLETPLGAKELTAYLKGVEQRLGRKKSEGKDGPRVIDLDVIVFNGEIVHGDFKRYDFVRDAVLELVPDLADEEEMAKRPENGDIDQAVIERHFREILGKGIKIDLNDPNFKATPARVARSYAEIFSGLRQSDEKIEKLFAACFPTSYQGIVAEKDITVFSMCPHHFLPIRYTVAVGYVPKGCGIGLSKLARIIELLAKKPVLQESFTQEIVDLIDKHMGPQGAVCRVEGEHYCMQMRGAKQKDVVTTTSAVKGIFLSKPEMELKFYELIRRR